MVFALPVFAQNSRAAHADNEYAMSHLEVDAGELVGLVVPERISKLRIKSWKWVPVERELISVKESSETSASVRTLRSGTTVVNYVYTYEVKDDEKPVMKDGKQVVVDRKPQKKEERLKKEGKYPFTIKIHKVDVESISSPSVITIGWDERADVENMVTFSPKYSESDIRIEIEDENVLSRLNGSNVKGEKLGSTIIHFYTPSGLESHSRADVVVPTLRRVEIYADEKMMEVDDEMQLTYAFAPKRATPSFTWKSSNPEVLEVTEEGLVRAKSKGKAKITIVSDNGVTNTIEIKVNKKK